jgi:hypothetical protein
VGTNARGFAEAFDARPGIARQCERDHVIKTFIQRLIGAATLDGRTYEEVEADRTATGQAGLVVLLSSLAAVTALWMLLAMVVAVRHALDYTSTAHALGVCVLGWAFSLAVAAAIGILFATPVS